MKIGEIKNYHIHVQTTANQILFEGNTNDMDDSIKSLDIIKADLKAPTLFIEVT